jgi:hypothetical protein
MKKCHHLKPFLYNFFILVPAVTLSITIKKCNTHLYVMLVAAFFICTPSVILLIVVMYPICNLIFYFLAQPSQTIFIQFLYLGACSNTQHYNKNATIIFMLCWLLHFYLYTERHYADCADEPFM